MFVQCRFPALLRRYHNPHIILQALMLTLLSSPVLSALALRAPDRSANTASTRGWSRSGSGSGARSSCASIPAGTIPVLVADGYPPQFPAPPSSPSLSTRPMPAEPATSGCCRETPGPARRGAPAGELVQRQILCRGQRPAGHRAVVQAAYDARAGRRAARHRDAMRAARRNIRYHLAYIGWLVRHARLAGRRPA